MKSVRAPAFAVHASLPTFHTATPAANDATRSAHARRDAPLDVRGRRRQPRRWPLDRLIVLHPPSSPATHRRTCRCDKVLSVRAPPLVV